MRRRFLNVLLVAGLVLSAFLGALGVASASHDDYAPQAGHSYLPWVPNGAMLDGQGPFYGTVTIQNLESVYAEIDVHVGVGTSSTNYELAETILLSPNESMTLSASSLDIPAEGASVKVLGWLTREELDDDGDVVEGTDDIAADIAALVKIVGPQPSVQGTTGSMHMTVDGYSGLTQSQVESEQDQFVLPIVQTNSGWDTMIRIANFNEDGTGLANVSITLYEAGGQGFGGESQVINRQIRPGGVASIDLSDYVAEGWVGSAFITSSADIGAVAERHKAENNMLVNNVSRPIAGAEHTEQFAPLVFKQFNFWNTGISVANTSESNWNQVTISYYGPTMNVVATDTLNIPPRGMEFIHTPGDQDLGLDSGFVGSAKLTGTQPFHAAVDQVKYLGQDQDVGQAMSYVVDQETARAHAETFYDNNSGDDLLFTSNDRLALPLAQKGNPGTGMGDTSGVQLFNTSAGAHAEVEVVFYSAAGIPVAPTVDPAGDAAPLKLDLAAHQSYTLYTHQLQELSSGYQGSVIVEVVGGDGEIAAVSNNVNYAVGGDGSAAFNLVKAEPRLAPALIYASLAGLDGLQPGDVIQSDLISIVYVPGPAEGGRDYPGGFATLWEMQVPDGCVDGWSLGDYSPSLGWVLGYGDLVVDECGADGVYRIMIEQIPATYTYLVIARSWGEAINANMPVGEYTVTGRLIDIEADTVIALHTSTFTIVE